MKAYTTAMTFLHSLKSHNATRFLQILFKNLEQDFIGLLAAGIAFYFFLAVFPAIAAAISLYGLFADPSFVTAQIESLSAFLPSESLNILAAQAQKIASASDATLGAGFFISIVFTIYSAARGVSALIRGLNIAYNINQKRSLLRHNSLSFTLTFLMLGYVLFALSLIAFMPAVFQFLEFPLELSAPLLTLRWPLLLLTGAVGLQILYNHAPYHKRGAYKRTVLSIGAVTATVLWVVGSALFSTFVSNFGDYNETYGSLAAVVILLLWLWLSSLCILMGAEINASLSELRSA